MLYRVINRETKEVAIEYISISEAMSWCASIYYFERM